jgi:hypothetical protein
MQYQPPIRPRCPSQFPDTPDGHPCLISQRCWDKLVERSANLEECVFTGESGEILLTQGAPIDQPCGFLVLGGSLTEFMDVEYEGLRSPQPFAITRTAGDMACLFGLMGSRGVQMPYTVAVTNGLMARYVKLKWNQIFRNLRLPEATLNAIREQHVARNNARSTFRNERLVELMQRHIFMLKARVDELASENTRLLQSAGQPPRPHTGRRSGGIPVAAHARCATHPHR